MSDKLVEIQHLKQYFPAGGYGKNKRYVKAVDDVSFYVNKGETLGLVGESGCGKTTTGRSLLRLYEPTAGKIIYDDQVIFDSENKIAVDMLPYRKKMQIVFQDPYASLDPRMTVADIIGEAIDIHKLAANKKERYDIIIDMLRKVGLNSEHANRYPHEFSGGQRQRVGIARALAVNPQFIVCDEPISALDVSIQAQVINMFEDLQQEMGLTYLFIAHDLSIVRFISDRIGIIYKGNIVEVAEAEELFDFPMHPYTHSLISAIPIPDPVLEKNKELYTYDPSIHDYSVDKPELVDIGNNHLVYGNKAEIEHYKKLRAEGKKVKSITILTPEEKAKRDAERQDTASGEVILDHPVHDTGNFWYKFLAFFLPILGLLGGLIFKSKNYLNNFKALKKGAIAGLIFRLVVLLLFGLLLILAII